MFRKVIVTVSDNKEKNTLFSVEERIEMIKSVTSDFPEGVVEVESFSGLLVEFVKEKKSNFVIRALRAVSDFEYEFQMAVMNKNLDPDFETIFLMTNKDYFYLSSSVVKQVACSKGDVSQFVPGFVEKKLKEKY